MKCLHRSLVSALIIQTAIIAGHATLAPPTSTAEPFTWKGPGGTVDNPKSGNWNAGANWMDGLPTSGQNTSLIFKSGADAYKATNDFGNPPFVLNAITFRTGGDGGEITVDGNGIRLVPNSVGGKAFLAQQGKAPVVLSPARISVGNDEDLFVSGDGTGRVRIGAADAPGIIAGNGGVGLVMGGAFTLELSGKDPNDFGSRTLVRSGVVELNKKAGVVAIPANLRINETGGKGAPTVKALADGQIAEASDVVFNAGGLLDINETKQTIGSLASAGATATVTLGAGTLTLSGKGSATATYKGKLTAGGGASPGQLVMQAGPRGPGYDLTFDNTGGTGFDGTAFQGVIEVQGGNLRFKNAEIGKNVEGGRCEQVKVKAGNISGTGSIFCEKAPVGGARIRGVQVFAGAKMVLGESVGLLQVLSVELDPDAVLGVHLDGSLASLLEVLDDVAEIDGSMLQILLDSPPVLDHEYLIVKNDGAGSVAGRFSGLPSEGSHVFAALGDTTYVFSISYTAGDGNDIVLRAEGIPAPAPLGLLAAGATGSLVWFRWVHGRGRTRTQPRPRSARSAARVRAARFIRGAASSHLPPLAD